MKKISIGADHRGYELKQKLMQMCCDVTWHDVGTNSAQRVDYPIFAQAVCQDVVSGACARGIIICGSGIGASIAANRMPGIYAGLCWNEHVVRAARQDDDINILVLPADFIESAEQAVTLVQLFLSEPFKGGRYQDRLAMIDD